MKNKENITHHSSLIANAKKQPYKAPERYFEGFDSKMMDKIQNLETLPKRNFRFSQLAYAASFIGLMLLGIFWFLKEGNLENLAEKQLAKKLENVDSEIVVDYLIENVAMINVIESNEELLENMNLNNFENHMPEINSEDLENYLLENNDELLNLEI